MSMHYDPYVATLPPRPSKLAAPPRRRKRWRIALLVVVSTLLGSQLTLFGSRFVEARAEPAPQRAAPELAQAAGQATVAARTDLYDAEKQTISIFSKASPSVVFITTLAQRRLPFQLNATTIPSGTGSGFVWDDKGHIVTNYHVIRNASGARVTLSDRSIWDAKLVGYAADKDIAVLRIGASADRLEPLPVGSSENLLVGQHVMAIGNPFGLDHTLSTGVISGVGREIKSLAGLPITGVIQTDAAINPGNSGGPLLDSRGRLIGINTAIFSPSGASAGIGFAVPVDTVKRIVPQLVQHGRVTRPGLGVEIAEAGMLRGARIDGVLVLGVRDGSGAEQAGIRPTQRDPRTGDVVFGDVIVGLDGKRVRQPIDLFRALDQKKVGDTVAVDLRRGDEELSVKVKLGALDQG